MRSRRPSKPPNPRLGTSISKCSPSRPMACTPARDVDGAAVGSSCQRTAMPFPYRKSLFVLLGVAACRARDAAPPVQAQVHFQIAPMGAPDLRAIAAIQNHFWITTSAGVVVIDPVAETWSTVFVDSAPVGEVEVIPCGSHVWLLRHDTLIVIDVETQRMEIRAARPGTQDPRPSLIASRCGMGALW